MHNIQTDIDTDLEEEARRLFTAAAENVPPAADLLRGLRARRARRARARAVMSTATAGSVAAGTFFALTATGAPSALAQVASAASRTAAQSYSVTAVTTTGETGVRGVQWRPIGRQQISAQFDPARRVGEQTASDGVQIRYIGDYEYIREPSAVHGRSWLKTRELSVAEPRTESGQALFDSLLRLSQVYPQNLLRTLQSAGRVRAAGGASGPGWSGTRYEIAASTPQYVFELTPSRHPRARMVKIGEAVTTSGSVDVDRQGRVRRIDVTVRTPLPYGRPNGAMSARGALVTAIQMTLGDFGAPVSVAAPPPNETTTQPGTGISMPVVLAAGEMSVAVPVTPVIAPTPAGAPKPLPRR
ncbi:MAG: hypothetical protein JOY82_28140 [Streptosporangiaceae bacterium]|nr:hypothetical protein [Streptosporangiaceae bacterium]MBV9858357.1 hypothetical protein [Streptosporangiaceae bacterium]